MRNRAYELAQQAAITRDKLAAARAKGAGDAAVAGQVGNLVAQLPGMAVKAGSAMQSDADMRAKLAVAGVQAPGAGLVTDAAGKVASHADAGVKPWEIKYQKSPSEIAKAALEDAAPKVGTGFFDDIFGMNSRARASAVASRVGDVSSQVEKKREEEYKHATARHADETHRADKDQSQKNTDRAFDAGRGDRKEDVEFRNDKEGHSHKRESVADSHWGANYELNARRTAAMEKAAANKALKDEELLNPDGFKLTNVTRNKIQDGMQKWTVAKNAANKIVEMVKAHPEIAQYTGPLDAKFDEFLMDVGIPAPEAAKIRSAMKSNTFDFRVNVTGAAAGAKEDRDIGSIVPQETDTVDNILGKAQGMLMIYDSKLDTWSDMLRTNDIRGKGKPDPQKTADMDEMAKLEAEALDEDE